MVSDKWFGSTGTGVIGTNSPDGHFILNFKWMNAASCFHLGTRSRTVDYVTDFEGMSYTEILAVTVADVLVFGKPSINFTYVNIRLVHYHITCLVA